MTQKIRIESPLSFPTMQISCEPSHMAKNEKTSTALTTLNATLDREAALVNLGGPVVVVLVLLAAL
jgi:hypothetical protein